MVRFPIKSLPKCRANLTPVYWCLCYQNKDTQEEKKKEKKGKERKKEKGGEGGREMTKRNLWGEEEIKATYRDILNHDHSGPIIL